MEPTPIVNSWTQLLGGVSVKITLEQIASEDPELYAEVKKHFLSFDDLLEMPNHLMSLYWRNPDVDVDNLAKAFKGMEEDKVQEILNFLPKRKQAMYTPVEQPLSKREVDYAKLSFVNLARSMDKAGEINLADVLNSEEDMIE